MDKLIGIVGEWVWGSNPSEEVTPAVCIDTIPFLTSPCFSALLVKGVGVGIIIGACLNKLPVILKILKNDSVAGLALGSVYGDAIMYSNAAFYGILRKNPFTSWGENGVVTLQALFICLLVWKYHDPTITMQQKALAFAVYAAYAMMSFTMLPPEYFYMLQTANWPVLIYSRGSAIIETQQVKHTGTQSIITHGMNLAGSAIRIVTTISEIGWDMTLLWGYGISALLNIVLVLQCIVFKENTDIFLEGLAKKKKE